MNKLEAIKQTIYNLENDVYEYNWTNADTCNCGVVARTIMGGVRANEAGFSNTPSIDHDLTCFAGWGHCLTTNLPLPRVFQELKDAGFSHQDLIELENLSNKKVATAIGISPYEFPEKKYWLSSERTNKSWLIKYLKAWAEILEQDGQATEAKPIEPPKPEVIVKEKKVTVYVAVSEFIKGEVKAHEVEALN